MLSVHFPWIVPVRRELEQGALLNPDGHGWARLSLNGSLVTFRSLDAQEAIDSYLAARELYPSAVLMFHSRHATGSPVTLENCQPLPVGGDPEVVVAHNGHLFTPEDSEASDTAIFAGTMLPHYDVEDPRQRVILEERLGHNKMVIFSGRTGSAHILNGKYWTRSESGAWHSNTSFTGVSHRTPGVCVFCQAPDSWEPVPGGSTACISCSTAIAERAELLLQPV